MRSLRVRSHLVLLLPQPTLSKCQINGREKWLRGHGRELLRVCYYHLVFSVPHALAPLIWQKKRVLFTLLFDASATTLLEVAVAAKHLCAAISV
jgi:hypothetical protein